MRGNCKFLLWNKKRFIHSNYTIYGCSSARATPGGLLYRSLTFEENIVAVITQDKVVDDR